MINQGVKTLVYQDLIFLMDKLGVGNKNNLFELVKFLKSYHSSNTKDSQIYLTYKEKIISKINSQSYKNTTNKRIKDKDEKSNFEHFLKIPENFSRIKKFLELPNFEQKNVIYLFWFIFYCETYQFPDESDYNHKILKGYNELIKQIKSLTINE